LTPSANASRFLATRFPAKSDLLLVHQERQ
jgi:hypothetical protein